MPETTAAPTSDTTCDLVVVGAGILGLAVAREALRRDPGLGVHLLIDSHNQPVAETVWDLLAILLDHAPRRPVLLERDENIPPFSDLLKERERAATLLLGKDVCHV